MHGLTQYQALTEPIPADPTQTVTQTDWRVETNLPRNPVKPRQVGGATPVLEPSLTTAFAWDWWQEASRPRNPVKPRQEGLTLLIVEQTLYTAAQIDWYRETIPPRNPAKKQAPVGEYSSSPIETSETQWEVVWGQEVGRPTRRKARTPADTSTAAPDPTLIPGISTAWDTGTNRPRAAVKARQYQTFAPSPEPSVVVARALDWFIEAERPRNPIKPRQYQPFAPPDDQPIPRSDWFPPSPMPTRRRPGTSLGLSAAQIVLDLIGLDWLKGTETPPAKVKPRQVAYPVWPDVRLVEPELGWLAPIDVRAPIRRPAVVQSVRETMPPTVSFGLLPDDRDGVGAASRDMEADGAASRNMDADGRGDNDFDSTGRPPNP